MPISRAQWAVTDWIQTAGLDLAVDKSMAMSFTSKYKIKEPRIVLQLKVINFSHGIKYLGLEIDQNE